MESAAPLEFTVQADEEDLRLEQFIRQRIPGISRGSVQRLLERQLILVNGRSEPKGLRVNAGQQVLVAAAARHESPVPQPELELQVLQVLPDMVAINKAAGMACHPLVPGETETVANALVARYPECAAASPSLREAGLVHRLDWSTSGVLLAARNHEAYGRLRGLFSSRQVCKHYLALVDGVLEQGGTISKALRTMPGDHRRMEVMTVDKISGVQSAETIFEPQQVIGSYTLVKISCCTGRRHQVRAHLAHLSHPLVGDALYGGSTLANSEGAFLHASALQIQPVDLLFEAPLPQFRMAVLYDLGARL